MPTPQPKSKQKNPNKVDLLKAIDKAPTKGPGGPGAPGGTGMPQGPGQAPMAPPPFPYPAHQLDRSASGVPNITDMFLHSLRPQSPAGSMSMVPPSAAPPPTGQAGGGGAPPMAAKGAGPRPQRRMS